MKTKKKTIIGIIAVLAAFLIYHLLEASAPFQHPEDAETHEYFEAELALLRGFAERHGMDALEQFRNDPSPFGWNMMTSGDTRRDYVPWAVFKSRKTQMEDRINNLKEKFGRTENAWMILHPEN